MMEIHDVFSYRELAKENLNHLGKEMENASNEVLIELSNKCIKCQQDVKRNEFCLLDLQMNYFEKCLHYTTASCDLMVEDQQKYHLEFDQSPGISSSFQFLICKFLFLKFTQDRRTGIKL